MNAKPIAGIVSCVLIALVLFASDERIIELIGFSLLILAYILSVSLVAQSEKKTARSKSDRAKYN